MAGKGNTAKLHHYVPQGYLRGFATEKQRITTVPLNRSREPFTASVRNVAAQNHFHTIEELEEPDAFEKSLSAVEGDAIRTIRNFERGEFPPSEPDRWAFANYMALQSTRGPDARKTIEHMQAHVVRIEIGAGGRKNVGAWVKRNHGFEPTPELEDLIWNDAMQPGGPSITLSNLTHIQHALETAQEVTPYLAARPWTLVQFDRRALITSDAPVSRIANPDSRPGDGVGVATALGITFPLTRKLGLFMIDPISALKHMEPDDPRITTMRAEVLRGDFDRIQAGTTAMEKLFNVHTARSAREYVYHHPEDGKFVLEDLPEPNLINVRVQGLADVRFDGETWGNADAREGGNGDGDGPIPR